MKQIPSFTIRALLLSALLFQSHIQSQDLTLAPLNNTPFRFKDLTGHHFSNAFTQNYAYAASHVVISLDAPGKPYLSGLIQAAGLKPNFAYQIKLAGRNSKLGLSATGAAPDDPTNIQLGLIGRWWRAYPNPANANDSDYLAHKDDPAYAYSGYLIIAFFITDENGAASARFEGSNSFHVLWRTNQRTPTANDGPEFDLTVPATINNPAYDPATATPAAAIGIYGEWEPTRAPPNSLNMPQAHYACDFILTEESFHDFGIDAGNWTSVLGAPLEFDLNGGIQQSWTAPAPLAYPAALDSTQLNASASVPGTFSYTPPAATVLPAGSNTLTAQFTPADATLKIPPPISVSLLINKGLPVVAWNPPPLVRANKPLGADLFSFSASAPGAFTHDLPPSGILAPGVHTFTLQFTPADLSNYNTPAPLTVTLTAIQGLLISSGPDAAPNPAYAGWPVRVSAQSIARGLSWSWDFGDGSAPATGNSAAHIFAAPGIYTVTLSVQVHGGRTETAVLTATVLAPGIATALADDADLDGFSNALELALGSDPFSAASTPLKSIGHLNAGALNVARCQINVPLIAVPLSSASAKTPVAPAALHFTATLPAAKGLALSGQTLALDIGGNVLVFTLDAHGKSRSPTAKASARINNAGKATIEIVATGFDMPLTGMFNAPAASTQSAHILLLLGHEAASATLNFKITPVRATLLFIKQ